MHPHTESIMQLHCNSLEAILELHEAHLLQSIVVIYFLTLLFFLASGASIVTGTVTHSPFRVIQ
jgi:positive regulator of sigma E activity